MCVILANLCELPAIFSAMAWIEEWSEWKSACILFQSDFWISFLLFLIYECVFRLLIFYEIVTFNGGTQFSRNL